MRQRKGKNKGRENVDEEAGTEGGKYRNEVDKGERVEEEDGRKEEQKKKRKRKGNEREKIGGV